MPYNQKNEVKVEFFLYIVVDKSMVYSYNNLAA